MKTVRKIWDWHRDLKSEPVIMFMGYGIATLLVHSAIGQIIVAMAYMSVATISAKDAHRERVHHYDNN